MKILAIGAIVAMSLLAAPSALSQMKKPHEWGNYEKVFGVVNGQRHYDFDVVATEASQRANVFYPGDSIRFRFQVVNNMPKAVDRDAVIRVIHYGTEGLEGDLWVPQIKQLGPEKDYTRRVRMDANGYCDVALAVDEPDEFGGYAVVFDLGDAGRRLATSFVYAMKPKVEPMQYPRQALDDLGPDYLNRVGVQAIRHGIGYMPTTSFGYRKFMEDVDKRMKEYKAHNVTMLLMIGEGGALMPLGTPRAHIDENGFMLRTKQDYVWLPSLDEDFKKFVKEVLLKYGWPRGPVTAVSLWNEPWEGISISGWQADMPRYREIYTKMAEAVLEARKEGVDVLVGGGDSNSNALDKFFGDGTMAMLPVFDFMSIHYQGMESPVLYPEFNNRKDHKGKVLIWDTESWVGNTDDRIGMVIAANRSAGYDRSMGIYGGYLQSGHQDDKVAVRTPSGVLRYPAVLPVWSQTAAICAVQNMIGERAFRRLLFPQGLPWVMLFDGYDGNPDDGTAVVAGDMSDAFGAENLLYRGVMLSDGVMRVKAHKSFRLYDFYGNEIPAEKGYYSIPLTWKGYYLRTDGSRGSFARLEKALAQAEISGYSPLDIAARDLTAPVESRPEFELVLTNVLNCRAKGALKVTLGDLALEYPAKIDIAPNSTSVVKVKVVGGTANPANDYPLAVTFTAVDGSVAELEETLHVNLISRRTVKVDGDLADWEGAIPQTVRADGKASLTVTEAAWYPFMSFDSGAKGMAQAWLGYDDDYFYFAAKVADSTPNPGGPRFATRDDDSYFYPDTAYMQTINAMHSVVGRSGGNVYWENTRTTQSIGVDLDLPSDRVTRAALYFPAVAQHGVEVTVTDRATGNELLQTRIDNLWNGAWVNLNLSGDVRIRCSAYGWWYTAKLAGVWLDETSVPATAAVSATLAGVDFDTVDNWAGVYGSAGYVSADGTSSLPSWAGFSVVEQDDAVALAWPDGVRRFTYRKQPTLPDGTVGTRFDNILIAFNVIPQGEDGLEAAAPGTMPGYIGYKCTDYEYALNPVAEEYGGGTEIWRMLAPGLPRKHFYPRQGKAAGEGAVEDGKLVIRRDGNTLFYECAIPMSEIPDVRKAIDSGEPIKFSFRVNDDTSGACMELAKGRSVAKRNSRAFHPDWKEHWSNEVGFGVEK